MAPNPAETVRPQDRGEVIAALRQGADRGESLTVRGLGSRRILLPGPGRVLSLERLDGMLEVDAEEQILTADAGTGLTAIQAALGELGLFLPPLGIGPMEGTIGGLYNDPRELPFSERWGRTRDSVLGVEAVRGDGTPFKAGGRVVKNVTGYDLTRLLCGSRGTLAVTTRLHWRLAWRPEQLLATTVSFATAETAEGALTRLRESGLDPLLVQLAGDAGPNAEVNLHLLEGGRRDALARRVERQREVLDGRTVTPPTEIAAGAVTVPGISPPGGGAAEEGDLLVRVRLPFRDWMGLLRGRVSLPGPPRWYAVYPFARFGIAELAAKDHREETFLGFRREVERIGGSVQLERIPAGWRSDVDPWGMRPSTRRFTEALRREWDPQGVLAAPLSENVSP